MYCAFHLPSVVLRDVAEEVSALGGWQSSCVRGDVFPVAGDEGFGQAAKHQRCHSLAGCINLFHHHGLRPDVPAPRIVVDEAGNPDARTYGLRPCQFARNGEGVRPGFSSGFALSSKASFTRALNSSVDTI
jgi:hypothetical protein